MALDDHRQSSAHFIHKDIVSEFLCSPDFIEMSSPLNGDAPTRNQVRILLPSNSAWLMK